MLENDSFQPYRSHDLVIKVVLISFADAEDQTSCYCLKIFKPIAFIGNFSAACNSFGFLECYNETVFYLITEANVQHYRRSR